MKYLNLGMLLFVISLFGIVVYLGLTGRWYDLFIVPVLIVGGFTIFYLRKKLEEQEKDITEREVDLAIEDNKAEEWMKESFVPQTITFGKKNNKRVVIYLFFFLALIYFLWNYLSVGLEKGLLEVIRASILFWVFIFYIYLAPVFYKRIGSLLPESIRNIYPELKDGELWREWVRAYIFLLPICFLMYLLYPLDDVARSLVIKFWSGPLFFLIYTFVFLGLYSVVFIDSDMRRQESDKLEMEVKRKMEEAV